ncbi:bifunctional adenosylcobinamide kinase/adenosylcobinamide-phosphate guanylyltransferase [Tepidimonas sp.]|uniref:bifunctional adenosylcobinamide kinase/adenosylcobinamide-phosphate guanylyltransferase n=1 Tax=Tepidimonas sp. TaxID=2002775 RepID=UPI002FDF6675
MAEAVWRELIVGGQKSGKSARAERLAAEWLAAGPQRRAVLLATAEARDAEMRARIERHQRQRLARVPALQTLEVGADLPQQLVRHSSPRALVVVDCLTLWLTQLGWPAQAPAQHRPDPPVWESATEELVQALRAVSGPVVLVGNEIGLGVIPPAPEVRGFVDALGRLNQAVAAACERVTLMVAGCPLVVKGGTP